MTQNQPDEYEDGQNAIRRRALLTGIAAATAGAAGCSDEETNVTTETETPNQSEEELPSAFSSAVRTTEEVYRRLDAAPIEEEGDYVFSIKTYNKEVDAEQALRTVQELMDEMTAAEYDEVPEKKRSQLYTAAELGYFSTKQRFRFYEAIAAGIVYQRKFGDDDIQEAIETIKEAQKKLVYISEESERIQAVFEQTNDDDALIEGYDHRSIQQTQQMVSQVLSWIDPVYDGLTLITEGIGKLDRGADAVENEDFGRAEVTFEAAVEQFREAEAAFNTAHGRGQRVDEIVPVVEDARCVLSGLKHLDEIGDAFGDINEGNRERGMKQAREGYNKFDRSISRCE